MTFTAVSGEEEPVQLVLIPRTSPFAVVSNIYDVFSGTAALMHQLL